MKYTLRDVEFEDHKWLVELHNDPLVLYNITNPNPITIDEHLKWWYSLGNSQKRMIFCVDGVRAGFCKFYDIDYINNCCVLGADLHKDFRGHGYSLDMWKLMLEYCFGELNLFRVSLQTAEYNTIAQHIYNKLGFKLEGVLNKSLFRDGNYYNQYCMYFLKEWK
jgi:diamine N-acetyltransferase